MKKLQEGQGNVPNTNQSFQEERVRIKQPEKVREKYIHTCIPTYIHSHANCYVCSIYVCMECMTGKEEQRERERERERAPRIQKKTFQNAIRV